ncbi:hypothetical protein NFI96_033447 [Prochilodus magdalenae]|nr:hypothetical protein NFI96_033447 [Prochilodus magdalenae]
MDLQLVATPHWGYKEPTHLQLERSCGTASSFLALECSGQTCVLRPLSERVAITASFQDLCGLRQMRLLHLIYRGKKLFKCEFWLNHHFTVEYSMCVVGLVGHWFELIWQKGGHCKNSHINVEVDLGAEYKLTKQSTLGSHCGDGTALKPGIPLYQKSLHELRNTCLLVHRHDEPQDPPVSPHDLGITGTAGKWFESYLEDCHYQVTWNGSTSAPCRLSTGVPQGSVLGHLLFSLYTLSLGEVITSHSFSYHCYADDTQLMLSFPSSDTQVCNRILPCLTDISSWITAYHLKPNPSKTELLFILSTTSPHHDLAISFGNSLITPTEDAKSLGVILDGQLSFSAYIANLTRSYRFLL